jgi:hypothetical protein
VTLDMRAEPYAQRLAHVEHGITVSPYDGSVDNETRCRKISKLFADELYPERGGVGEGVVCCHVS